MGQKNLPQIDENHSGYGRSKRYPFDLEIPNDQFVGPRGGVRIPLAIVWKNMGTSIFTKIWGDGSGAALFPYVRWHNGNGKMRTTYAPDWVKTVGLGKALPQTSTVLGDLSHA